MLGMDLLLLSFSNSTDERECERNLSELILVHVTPLVRRKLRQRLGIYVDHTGANPNNPEAEDLYHDIILKVIERLNKSKADPDRHAIRDFRQYVARVATNACNDYLRGKSPARARLKNNLRDIFDRHQDFLMWKNAAQETLCGFSKWRNRKISTAAREKIRQLEENPEVFNQAKFLRDNVQNVPLTRLVAIVFKWVKSPIEIESLVKIVARVQGVKDHTIESLDDYESNWNQRLIDSAVRCHTHIEAREMLQRLWDEIQRLPPKQRDAFCLSFEDDSGEDLFSLLLAAGVVTLPQMACELDMSLDRLMSLWKDMPMDSQTVALVLGATRPQVNKWRFRALKQLEKQMIASGTRV